ncbi:MAG: hypothetical protein ACRED5_12455 [Propylenella sp.]
MTARVKSRVDDGEPEATGKTPTFDLVSKSCANLLRMWADD